MNQESWQIVLPQSLTKEHDKMSDFTGDANLGATSYEVAGWFGEISRGNNAGRPYIGLTLSAKGNASSQKINISLWEKQNRKASDDPHFKSTEELQGRKLVFSAWVEPVGELYQLHIQIEPFVARHGDLSEAALETHERLNTFVKSAALRLGASEKPKTERKAEPTNRPASRRESATLDLDTEPDELPF